MFLQELQQRLARDEIRLARLNHFRRYFVRMIRNRSVQPEHITRLGNFGDDGFAFARRRGKFCFASAQHENAARALSFDEQHSRLRIDGGGLDVVQLLYGGQWQITKEMFFADRADDTIIENVQTVWCTHNIPASSDCITLMM